jgi:DNA-binding transcriptional ArsR family regulator
MGMLRTDNPFDHTEIDDVIHGRLRLGIMAYLSGVSPAIFGELRDKVQATDGNLSTHLRKLEEAGYVRQEKTFVGRRPQTQIFSPTRAASAWLAWIARMQELIGAEPEPVRRFVR